MNLVKVAIVVAWMSHYSPGVMQSTAELRQNWGQLPEIETSCMLAGRYPDEIGSTVYIRPAEWAPDMSGKWTECTVVDVAGIADGGLDWMLKNGIMYESDAGTMLRLSGRLGKGLLIAIADRQSSASLLLKGTAQ